MCLCVGFLFICCFVVCLFGGRGLLLFVCVCECVRAGVRAGVCARAGACVGVRVCVCVCVNE